jgi:hypothetical protein
MRKPNGWVVAALTVALVFSARLEAQAAKSLSWDQAAATLADASSYTYRYYADGATAGVVLAGVVCTGTASPFACSGTLPTFSVGSHTLVLTAGSGAMESAGSSPLAFIVPGAPGNLRIK